MPDGERRSRPPLILVGGFALFIVITAYLVVSSVTTRSVPTFDPSPHAMASRDTAPRYDDTITVDASDAMQWRYLDFDRGSVVTPPDTAGWDVAVRRYRVIASDAIADLGPRRFEDVREAPPQGFVSNVTAGDTVNAAMRKWYRYSMLTHLLEPAGHTYVVRTRDRRFASMQVLSYYCTGLRPGCLTLRYTYPVPASLAAPRAAVGPP